MATTIERLASERARGPLINSGLQRTLIRKARDGDSSAREAVIAAWVPCAAAQVLRYRNASQTLSGAPELSDLLQVALAEVDRLIDAFAHDLGDAFTVRALGNMRKKVFLAFNREQPLITPPTEIRELRGAVNKAIRELSAEHSRLPTAREIAAHLEKPEDLIELALAELGDVRSLEAFSEASGLSDGGMIADSLHVLGDTRVGDPSSTERPVLSANLSAIESVVVRLRFTWGYSRRDVASLLTKPVSEVREIEENAGHALAGRPRPHSIDKPDEARSRSLSVEVDHDAVRAAFRDLPMRKRAQLGFYCAIAEERGAEAALGACSEVFRGEPKRAVADAISALMRAGSIEGGSTKAVRTAAVPVVADEHRKLESAVSRLPASDSEVLAPLLLEGRPPSEVCELLGVSPDVLAARRRLAMARLERIADKPSAPKIPRQEARLGASL